MKQFGIDRVRSDNNLHERLTGKRVALLCHPASVSSDGVHALDCLAQIPKLQITAAFGPQHGARGEKQDNMVESEDYLDPKHGIPVFSLYGEVRKPTAAMMDAFDVLLVDLQDIGTRIYTFVTTAVYMLDACASYGKEVWFLDRPNPAGRPLEGSILEEGWESFVGAAPLLMRHGLTLAEIARWYVSRKKLDVDLQIIAMEGYQPDAAPGFGWPINQVSWVNPSPNAASLNMARCFPGTVLLEGTWLSEGRGTTCPLEVVGHPELDFEHILQEMQKKQSAWLDGAFLRTCYFEPTFHKHVGKLCSGLQIHTDNKNYQHTLFRPYRLIALLLKVISEQYPDFEIWRDFHYEYETERLAIDLLSGGTFLREWVEDSAATCADLEKRLARDETLWQTERAPFILY